MEKKLEVQQKHWKQKKQFINLVLSPKSVLVYKDIKFVIVPVGKIF